METRHNLSAAGDSVTAPSGGSVAVSYTATGVTQLHRPRASISIYILILAVALFSIWASLFELAEVSTGSGKIVPRHKEQWIQSLEGGILVDLKVREGDVVEAGQVLAQLDRTRFESSAAESGSRMRAAQATVARLKAEVNGTRLEFPEAVRAYPDLVKSETSLYHSRRQGLDESVKGIDKTLKLIHRELELTEPLALKGAASQVEVLRLHRQVSELSARKSDLQMQYQVKAREELAKAEAEVEAQRSVTRGREDTLDRLTLTSPVRGIVKNVQVTTVGGVLPPNGSLMSIMPLDDQLLVETKISPRDIAFIHPEQPAMVKISAYDYAIYGGLKGKVTMISPDTIQDDVKRDVYYYRVYVETTEDRLRNKAGKEFSIVPGMVATVDIDTGRKTVMQYLLKPFNRAQEALRER